MAEGPPIENPTAPTFATARVSVSQSIAASATLLAWAWSNPVASAVASSMVEASCPRARSGAGAN